MASKDSDPRAAISEPQGQKQQVPAEAKDLDAAPVAVAKDAVCSTAAGPKAAVSSMVDVAKAAVQEGVEKTRLAVTSSVDAAAGLSVGQKVTSDLDLVLGKTGQWVDHYLPMTAEELAALAASVQGAEVAPLEQQKQQQSYYVCLGSLSTRLQQRAYQHSLSKMRSARQSALEALVQLQQAVDLIGSAKQTGDQMVHDSQEKLQQLWLEWRQGQPGSQEGDSTPQPEEMGSQALATVQTLLQQEQDAWQSLIASIQGLPTSMQEQVQQGCQHLGELQAAFSSAPSFQELPEGLLSQSREKLAKAQECLDDLLEYVIKNIPLTWVVGPLSPAGGSAEQVEEPAGEGKVEP
ncbi:perilipin-3-like isoform X1 [Alligator mississippiensis]|uniref:perilipin-3-like n=2 Tax=Alligator mississippiensis TaxID=8496 RepID=UPI002877302D|nr:perilipin-3-like isoform X1 [Alligator mississippiensis]XP_059576158.1 perilipin-3-like isoform X1 [Alligator mississippiensis]XP_059576188.1 perilipin-3-like [Alligator mississippiensis]XP_059580470.1 perilipin-3-like [Alligator mississippiensis]XP_059580471.1 perilipin-3-like isoform X1 [Alligator mississippiensis]